MDPTRDLLWTARQAAAELGVSERLAQSRALERHRRGEVYPLRAGHAWVAPPEWWKAVLGQRKPRGRPRKRRNPEDA
jgi:hypothetical protein